MLQENPIQQTGVKFDAENSEKYQIPAQCCAIVGKKPKQQVLYYQPLTEQIKHDIIYNKRMIFHPNDWNIYRFQVGRYLGRGKYGRVYLVREKQTKMIMALKVLSKKTILQQEVVGQVRRQIQIHSHLKHENILSMYGFFYNEDNLYIMIEYATKCDLYGLLKTKKRFDEPTARKFMIQMVKAIHYLQKMNIIHRDIKPENIMVSINQTLKLSDFGWAVKSKSNDRKTFCGTPDYFCPEIIKYKPFDYKVDNWSLGILAYELLCGVPPFYHEERKRMYNNITTKQITFPSYASKSFRDFVNKLTRKVPSQRMELSEALRHPWLQEQKMDAEDQKQAQISE